MTDSCLGKQTLTILVKSFSSGPFSENLETRTRMAVNRETGFRKVSGPLKCGVPKIRDIGTGMTAADIMQRRVVKADTFALKTCRNQLVERVTHRVTFFFFF